MSGMDAGDVLMEAKQEQVGIEPLMEKAVANAHSDEPPTLTDTALEREAHMDEANAGAAEEDLAMAAILMDVATSARNESVVSSPREVKEERTLHEQTTAMAPTSVSDIAIADEMAISNEPPTSAPKEEVAIAVAETSASVSTVGSVQTNGITLPSISSLSAATARYVALQASDPVRYQQAIAHLTQLRALGNPAVQSLLQHSILANQPGGASGVLPLQQLLQASAAAMATQVAPVVPQAKPVVHPPVTATKPRVKPPKAVRPIETAPVEQAQEESYGEDGTIRCICGIDDDDGFTIQCENCRVWQHAVCVNIDKRKVPDEYLCELCDPRWLDVKKAQATQRKRREREQARLKQIQSMAPPARPVGRPPKTSTSQEAGARNGLASSQAGRQRAGTLSQSNTPIGASNPASTGRKRLLSSVSNSRPPSDDESTPSTPGAMLNPSLSSTFLQPVAVSARELELEFSPLEQNNFSTKEAEQLCNTLFKRWTKDFDAEPLPQHFELTKEQRRDPTEPVVIRRALLHRSKLCSVVKRVRGDKASTNVNRYALFAKIDIPAGRYITQYLGEVYTLKMYKKDPMNQYAILGTMKPNVVTFPQSVLPLCADARCMGNDARFLRRSCRPNCYVRAFVLGDADRDPKYLAVRLGIFAEKDIPRGEELTLGWDWIPGHVCAQPVPDTDSDGLVMDIGETPEEIRAAEVRAMCYSAVLGVLECACTGRSKCCLERMHRWLEGYKRAGKFLAEVNALDEEFIVADVAPEEALVSIADADAVESDDGDDVQVDESDASDESVKVIRRGRPPKRKPRDVGDGNVKIASKAVSEEEDDDKGVGKADDSNRPMVSASTVAPRPHPVIRRSGRMPPKKMWVQKFLEQGLDSRPRTPVSVDGDRKRGLAETLFDDAGSGETESKKVKLDIISEIASSDQPTPPMQAPTPLAKVKLSLQDYMTKRHQRTDSNPDVSPDGNHDNVQQPVVDESNLPGIRVQSPLSTYDRKRRKVSEDSVDTEEKEYRIPRTDMKSPTSLDDPEAGKATLADATSLKYSLSPSSITSRPMPDDTRRRFTSTLEDEQAFKRSRSPAYARYESSLTASPLRDGPRQGPGSEQGYYRRDGYESQPYDDKMSYERGPNPSYRGTPSVDRGYPDSMYSAASYQDARSRSSSFYHAPATAPYRDAGTWQQRDAPVSGYRAEAPRTNPFPPERSYRPGDARWQRDPVNGGGHPYPPASRHAPAPYVPASSSSATYFPPTGPAAYPPNREDRNPPPPRERGPIDTQPLGIDRYVPGGGAPPANAPLPTGPSGWGDGRPR